MGSHRNAASRQSTVEDRASAEALRVEEGQPARDKTGSDNTPPRAGRTGSFGAKAERPAENRAHKSGHDDAEPARGGKPPSPAANEREPGEGTPPLPVRDSTA